MKVRMRTSHTRNDCPAKKKFRLIRFNAQISMTSRFLDIQSWVNKKNIIDLESSTYCIMDNTVLHQSQ